MFRRLTGILLLASVFTTAAAENFERQAEEALMNGDTEAALENYMMVVEQDPDNEQAVEMVVMLANEAGLPDLGSMVLLGQVEAAVASGNKARIANLNDEISRLYESLPGWVGESLEAVSMVDGGEAEIIEAFESMSAEAGGFAASGDYDGAISVQDGAYSLAQDMLGAESYFTGVAARDLGFYFRQAGIAAEADAFYNEAAAILTGVLGDTHPATLQVYELLAELYLAAGAIDESVGLYDSLVATYANNFGQAHSLTVSAMLNRYRAYEGAGLYEDANVALQEACTVINNNYGAWHPQATNCESQLAELLRVQGDLDTSLATYEDLVRVYGESLPSMNSDVLYALNQQANVLREMGDYQQARDILSGVIDVGAKMGDLSATFTAKNYLGRVLNNEGELERARILTEQVLDFGLANWQNEPLSIYNTLLELGAIQQAQGNLAEAEATYAEALQGLLGVVGDMHPSTLVAMANLGQVYEANGLYDLAEPLLKQSLENMEQALGPDNPQTSRVRNNLALLHESQGNFREAEPLYQQSIDILTATRGENYTDTIAVRNNLAYLYMLMEEYDDAASMFQKVLDQWMVLFGDDHQNTLKAMNNLGRIKRRQNNLEEAEQLILQALTQRRAVLGENHLDVVRSMIDLGVVYIDQGRLDEAKATLEEALARAESILGNEHPYTFEALNNLAKVLEERNELQAAVELRDLGFRRRSRFLDRMLWVTGENAREGYIRLHRGEFNDYLALLERLGTPDAGKRVIDASLQRKGLLLKVTSEIQQISKLSSDPELTRLTAELEAARKELAALTLSGPTPETKGRHTEVLYDLEQKVNELQGDLGRASVRYRSSIAQVSVDTLASVMEDNTALVDYQFYESEGEGRVLAGLAIKQNDEVEYQLISLPDKASMESIIMEYREIIQDDAADEYDLLEVGQITYETVWLPIEEATGDIEHIYLIPDGVLNILPFNAMVNLDEEYLIRTHDLHILTSGRDLLPNDIRLAKGQYLVVAGPNYNSDNVVSEEALAAASARRSSSLQMGIRGAGSGLRGLNFAPLPGAEKEGQIIVDQVQKRNEPNETFFGDKAQEIVLADMNQAPEILHVATHGFFLEAEENLRKRLLKLQRSAELHVPPPGDNPLLRAGLAFAGINTNAQFLGDIETDNDGVLTALEVLDLNLSGTKLVVLSACETGIGEIHEGEGVYGLRRSFQEAGVAEVISSLWEVSDAGTQALMTSFYDRLLNGQNAREALRESQIEMMESPMWGYPYVWSAFMIVGSYESAGVTVQ